ncbi:MAG TPA: hypothetical protein VMS79_00655 [Methanomassiliicoccales archaeon]|nr:hypothetical protein [Methanomassiliicoccales archaeon]
MARRRRVLVIECIPQAEKFNEGKMLRHFLDMIFQNDRDRVAYYRVKGKTQLVNWIDQKKDISKYGFIHLSAHGKPDLGALELPRGILYPSDLRQGCLKGRILTLSACSTGRKEFVANLIDRTGAEAVIAPRDDVWFADAALWFTNFYYLVLEKGYEPRNACHRVNWMLRGKVKGGFKFYDRKLIESTINGRGWRSLFAG